jgi:hypothetical protein
MHESLFLCIATVVHNNIQTQSGVCCIVWIDLAASGYRACIAMKRCTRDAMYVAITSIWRCTVKRSFRWSMLLGALALALYGCLSPAPLEGDGSDDDEVLRAISLDETPSAAPADTAAEAARPVAPQAEPCPCDQPICRPGCVKGLAPHGKAPPPVAQDCSGTPNCGTGIPPGKAPPPVPPQAAPQVEPCPCTDPVCRPACTKQLAPPPVAEDCSGTPKCGPGIPPGKAPPPVPPPAAPQADPCPCTNPVCRPGCTK